MARADADRMSSRRSRCLPRVPSLLTLALALLALPAPAPRAADALHFYLTGNQQRCFFEELPKDTVVHGDYRLEETSSPGQPFARNPQQGLLIFVEEVPQRHRVLRQEGGPEGKFAFTAAENGEYAICVSTNTTTGWFSKGTTRIYLDLHVGEAEVYQDDHKNEVQDLTSQVRGLMNMATDILREQMWQKENEAKFRDMSEHVNSRVVYWTFLQLIIIACTGIWQMRHLKGFFTAKKLV